MKALTTSLMILQIMLALTCNATTLAWKFSPDDVQHYRLTQSSRLAGGDEGESKQLASIEQVLDLTWKVLEVSDSGDAKLSLEVTAFSMLAKGPDGQEVRFDSESTEEPTGYAAMLAPISKHLAESPIVFQMNSRGEITDAQLPEALADAVKLVPGGKKFAQDGGLASIETMARLGAPLDPPAGELKAGQEWAVEREVEIPGLGATTVVLSYKVADPISDDEITVEQQMSVAPVADKQVARFDKQQSTGTVVWDVAAGRPETSVLNYEVEIEQTGNLGGGLKLEQNTEFRRIADDTQ